MHRTACVLFILALTAESAQAGFFGKTPNADELAKIRQVEENCLAENSKALCTLQAAKTRFDLKDVEVAAEQWKQLGAAERDGGTMGDIAGIAASVTQMTSNTPGPVSLKGLGSINLLGSLLMMGSGNQRTSDNDRIVAFVSESQAADAEAAAKIIEDVYVNAFVHTLPGITSASYETIKLDKESRVGTYVLHGGECDRTKCVLWSYLWGQFCKDETCKHPASKLKLIEHGYLGKGRYWVTQFPIYVSLLDSPTQWRDMKNYGPLPDFITQEDRLALMHEVSRSLPPWASYYFGPSPGRKIPYPVLLNSGKSYFFVKQKKTENASANQN